MNVNYFTTIRAGWVALSVLAICAFANNYSSADNNSKVTICHCPPGAQQGQSIVVNQSSLQAHLAHGDAIGPCPVLLPHDPFEKE